MRGTTPGGCVKSSTGILPVGFCGIGILPMIHGLEAHAMPNRLFTPPLIRDVHVPPPSPVAGNCSTVRMKSTISRW